MRKMRQFPFCNKKNYVNFGIKLDADISIWMQSRFEGFDFSATLPAAATNQSLPARPTVR